MQDSYPRGGLGYRRSSIHREFELGNVRIISNFKSVPVPCDDCSKSSAQTGHQGDPETNVYCAKCGYKGASMFDQDGNSACESCSMQSLIQASKNDGMCWQCTKTSDSYNPSLVELPLCTFCIVSHDDPRHPKCNATCVRHLLSMLTSAFQHKLRSMTTFPTCVSDLVANYVGSDLFASRFYCMHEMMFLRPKESHCIQHKTIPRRYKASCKRDKPCLWTSSAEKTVYYCENPREIYLAYDIASHTCNSSCAAIVLRAWRACLQN